MPWVSLHRTTCSYLTCLKFLIIKRRATSLPINNQAGEISSFNTSIQSSPSPNAINDNNTSFESVWSGTPSNHGSAWSIASSVMCNYRDFGSHYTSSPVVVANDEDDVFGRGLDNSGIPAKPSSSTPLRTIQAKNGEAVLMEKRRS